VYHVTTALVSVRVTSSQFIGMAGRSSDAAAAYVRSGSMTVSRGVDATTVAHFRNWRRVK